MTISAWWRSATRRLDVDRSLGMLMSLSGVVLIVGEAARFTSELSSFSPWWTWAGVGMALLLLVSAAGCVSLSASTLKCVWAVFIGLLVALEITVFAAYHGPDPDQLFPWVWRFESIAVCYLVLLARPGVALAFPLLAALLPAASGLIFLGRVPEVVAAQTPLHLGNIVFAVFFLGMRSRLRALSQAEKAAREEEERRATLDAHARQEEQFTRIVHDELLSVFSAALHFDGHAPDVLRNEAAHALDRLHQGLVVITPAALVPAPEVCQAIIMATRDVLPHVRIDQQNDDSMVPTSASEAVRSALSEAARNAALHARGAATTLHIRVLEGRIVASLTDEGPGFDIDRVPHERLGVRESVLGRMRTLPGGSAHVETSPSGTRVVVGWRP